MLLDPEVWTGKIFAAGAWSPGSGHDVDIIEPATGQTIGRVGSASPADVATAAEHAATVQQQWADQPHHERATVMRKAGLLFAEHAEEIIGWNVREVGAIPPMAAFAVHVAEQEC